MKHIEIKAFAKVNLSIDILGKYPNGYHQVEMVMHQIDLHDKVAVNWIENEPNNDFVIQLKTNKYYLPVDERNLAYKAALLMKDKYGKDLRGTVKIDILKNIPVAAGLAGGSSNGAAVILGLNNLWKLNLDVKTMCEIASELGSDVPFTLMGQAKGNECLGEKINNDSLATTCALAAGTGTEMTPLPAIEKNILLSKPPISVSTAEVYKGMKLDEIESRPDNKELIEALENKDIEGVKKNMINVLEQYTLANYDIVVETKEKIKEACESASVLMSGSGPTVFAIVEDENELDRGYKILKEMNKETYITKTI